MSFPSVPSVEEVSKWKRAQVLTYLQSKKDELDLDNKHIKIIEDQKVAGRAFLNLTPEKLERLGMTGGPAETIVDLIRDIKGEPEGKYTILRSLTTNLHCFPCSNFIYCSL